MKYDIAIIGSGPNGDALACALADTNLKIAIIDKQPLKKLENPPTPKSIIFQNQTLETIEQI